jgi:acyl carrier protein
MAITVEKRLDVIRNILAEVLEIEPSEITDTSLFKEDHNADSLRAIEIMARLEKEFNIVIPQTELAKMVNLSGVHDVVKLCAGTNE